jgi:type I restriction enzyme S subunit
MSEKVKPGYKQTKVGVIPEEWKSSTVRGLASSARNAIVGGPFGSDLVSRDYVEHGVPVIRGQNMSGQWVSGNFVFVTSTKAKSLEANLARPGDIVFTQRGTLGQVSLVPEKPFESYLVSQSQMKLSVNREVADPLFFFYVFTSEKQQELIRGGTIQTGVPHINLGILRDIPVQLPPLPEQRAMAGALSDVDALIGALDSALSKKRDLKQAAMQQLLTGQKRLSGFHGEWETLNLSEKSTLKARIGWQGLTTAEYLKTGEYYLVTGTDFVNGRIDWSSCCFVASERYAEDRNIQLRPKDVLLTKDGTIGKVGFIDDLPGKATLNSGVFVIRPKDDAYDPQFFYYVLTSRIFDDFLIKLQAGSTISHLYQKDFVTFSFLAPATLDEQSAIAEVLSDMDAELTALTQRRDKTRVLKQGMMQELLTGRTRLV